MKVFEIDPGKKYLVSMDASVQHCERLMDRLNKWISSDDPFAVFSGDVAFARAVERVDSGLTREQDFVARLAHISGVDVPWAVFDEDGNPSLRVETDAKMTFAELIPDDAVQTLMDALSIPKGPEESLECPVEIEVRKWCNCQTEDETEHCSDECCRA